MIHPTAIVDPRAEIDASAVVLDYLLRRSQVSAV